MVQDNFYFVHLDPGIKTHNFTQLCNALFIMLISKLGMITNNKPVSWKINYDIGINT